MNYIDTKPARLCAVCGHSNEVGSDACKGCSAVFTLSAISKSIHKNLGLDKPLNGVYSTSCLREQYTDPAQASSVYCTCPKCIIT